MGFLSFRKKSKKSTSKKSVSSDMESATSSPVVQSLSTEASNIASNNLLDEILNDLPTSTKSFSGSETSSKYIRHSLNLKSNCSSNAKTISRFSHAPPPTTTPPMIRGRLSTSSDEFSIESFLSAEDHDIVPPNLSPAELKAEDTTPLIELISRSYATSSITTNSLKKTSIYTGVSVIQRSPGFAIDRMKERHRQEYHKSKQTHSYVVKNMATVVNQDSRTFRGNATSSDNQQYRSVMSASPEPQTIKYRSNEGPKHVTPSQPKVDNIKPLTNNNHQNCYTQPPVAHISHFSGKGNKNRKQEVEAETRSNKRTYHSVPNMPHMLDKEAKRIVDENHQHFNNKFIYRYSYHQCQQHRRKPEPRCSCQRRDKKQWKPLLKITPFEDQSGFSITEDAPPPAPKTDRPRLKAQNQRHHPDYVTALN